jgi:diguanylate cyclase
LAIVNSLFTENIKLLQTEASKTAYQGVVIAIIAILLATSLVTFINTGSVTLEGMWQSQRTNVALWILNCIPFVFGIWGQYSGSLLIDQAEAMVAEQTQELRTKTESLEKETAYASTHDKITDLPNRALFYDRVERAIITAARDGSTLQRLSILLIEIENLKEIYDTLGRNSSDSILKQLSTRLQAVSSETDVVAKIDGNIFGIMLSEDSDILSAEVFAQRIQKALESPFLLERLYVAIHSNIGIVHFPEHGQDVDALVQRAGVALHIAQRSTKGYALYEQSFDKHTPLRLTLMSELRHAIERDGLDLFYQPQIAIKAQEICGVEALLRWNHPVHGYITPDEFIPMAERNRMTRQLTQWVLRRAFHDCANWRKQGFTFTISVNLSARDLHDPDLPNLISGVAAASGIQPEWIILEITESSLMSEPENALEIIRRLHQMGYHFSIDDFGTGYSSLAYLKRMPLTELKIDKSFVLDILANENDSAIVKATINLAHNLGIQVIAEGVESQDILDRLMKYGCDIAQGYHFSRPLPVDKLNQWLSSSDWKKPV